MSKIHDTAAKYAVEELQELLHTSWKEKSQLERAIKDFLKAVDDGTLIRHYWINKRCEAAIKEEYIQRFRELVKCEPKPV